MKNSNEDYYARQSRRADQALPYLFWTLVGLVVATVVCNLLGINL